MRILLYDDSPDFGGHEVMAMLALQHIVAQPELRVGFMWHRSNDRLTERLEAIRSRQPQLEFHDSPYASGSLQGMHSLLARNRVNRLAQCFRAIGPDQILVVQGTIEIASLAALAARRAGIPALSYIPFAHTLRHTGAILARLRDIVNRRLYDSPAGFITCCRSGQRSLLERGVRVPVEVVYNSVDTKQLKPVPRIEARRQLGLQANAYIAAIVGRIHFKQKGHDFLIQALNRYRDRLGDLTLLIVGDGPDLGELRSLVNRSEIATRVHFIPWCNDVSAIYGAVDLLLLPSRFEGLPCVMLEALHCGLPIVASDCDGMAEVLPAEWRFSPGNAEALIETLLHVKCGNKLDEICRLQSRIATEFDPLTFGDRFLAAIYRLSTKQ